MNALVINYKPQIPISYHYQSEIHSVFRSKQSQTLNLKLLKKCSNLNQFKQLHTQILKNPSHQTNFLLSKLLESLVDSTHIDYATQVFEKMSERTTFAFNTMVRGYAIKGDNIKGIRIYIQMKAQGLQPDNFTYPFLLKACTNLNQGKIVHTLILKNPGFESDIYSQTSLISFYCGYGNLEYASKVFNRMLERNVVSWTAMITGYMKQKRYIDGLALFHQMQIEGIEINEFTLVNVLSACSRLGAFEMGRWVHEYINRKKVFLNPTLATGLIDMYVKCGYINEASQVFDTLTEKSVCTWNSIIGGLAMHGYGEDALERFNQMLMGVTKPDHITFLGVLSACIHSGMVEKGKNLFYSMTRDYGIEPNIKHYGCLVDLLGRAGHLKEAYEVMKNMPIKPNKVLWGALLNSCSTHGNVELAETAIQELIKLEPYNDGNYVLMSNIYAAKGQWENVIRMRRLMRDKGIHKIPGSSSIEVNNVIHEFVVGDSRHPRSKEIYSMLDDLALKLQDVVGERLKHY